MADETCRVEYTPEGGHRRGDRIVRCGKPAGHPERLHAEMIDGEFGPEWAADETPAQPMACDRQTCGATLAEYERDPCTRQICPLRDARPAAEAGRAGEDDVYLAAAQAYQRLSSHHRDVHEMVRRPQFRASIDAARAPLLAEIERLTVGKCFDAAPQLLGSVSTVMCTLAHGHRGAHTDGQATWTSLDEARAKAVDRHTLRLAFVALAASPQRCRYHGDDFGRLGWERGEPRCDSCKQPWRVKRALDAVERAITGPVTDDGNADG